MPAFLLPYNFKIQRNTFENQYFIKKLIYLKRQKCSYLSIPEICQICI
jgi:hypothetical protein